MAKPKPIFTAPWYPWYVNDVLTSERVKMLSLAEEGAYRRALDNSWKEGSIPADPAFCARVIGNGCTPKMAKKVLDTCFVPMPGNEVRMINLKQEKIRKEQAKKHKIRSEVGKKNVAKRWKNSNGIANSENGEKKEKVLDQKNKDKNGNENEIAVNNYKQKASSDSNAIPFDKHSDTDTDSSKEEKKESPNGDSKEAAPPRRGVSVRRPVRIPEPFKLTPERWAWLAENLPGLNDPNAAHANFVEYWTNAPPGKAEKLNWELAWQKGMRLAKKWQDEDAKNGTTSKRTGPDRRTDAEILRDSAEQIASKYPN